MKTDTLRFRDLLQKDIRLVVPLFQRPYVWNQRDQWEPLWEDIRNLAENILSDRFRRPHFRGAIVLEQVKTGAGEVEQRLVIDGQQRLTTTMIILEAFHDFCHEVGAKNPQAALSKMTRIDDPMVDEGGLIYKVWPTTLDSPNRSIRRCRTPHGPKRGRRSANTVPFASTARWPTRTNGTRGGSRPTPGACSRRRVRSGHTRDKQLEAIQ